VLTSKLGVRIYRRALIMWMGIKNGYLSAVGAIELDSQICYNSIVCYKNGRAKRTGLDVGRDTSMNTTSSMQCTRMAR
jgi:hypothetical protein